MRWDGAGLDWLVVLVFVGIAVWVLLAGPVARLLHQRFARGATWATATVVDAQTRTSTYRDREGRVSTGKKHYLEVEFTTEEGTPFRVRRQVLAPRRVGGDVPVLYHPEDPGGARLDWDLHPRSKYGTGRVMGSVFVLALGFAVLVAIEAIEIG